MINCRTDQAQDNCLQAAIKGAGKGGWGRMAAGVVAPATGLAGIRAALIRAGSGGIKETAG
ncbi:MAG: hypothetical protein A2Y80_02285 [Deltaproteobacteria bacterium RBG_13_58_19]|nr:MAG: hypothetical protein A2Y80_02285 [Deltaproteobacteria bacterium RBG_13_58_19]